MKPIKELSIKLYNWILSLSKSRYSFLALFIFALSEAIFFPIPPDLLLITLILGSRNDAMKYAVYCTLGSIIGGSLGYLIGYHLWWDGDSFTPIANYFFTNIPFFTMDVFLTIKNMFDEHGFLIIFTAGFTPIPYKIFSISAGINNISFATFVLASIISRSLRFFIIAILLYKFGNKIENIIKNNFNILSILITVFLIFIYLSIK